MVKPSLTRRANRGNRTFMRPTLRPHAHITQWVNSGNSRRAFKHVPKAKQAAKKILEIESTDGAAFTFDAPEPESVALARAKEQIKYLSDKHHGSLLVVTYMAIHAKLKKWAAQTGVLAPDYLQYYGNLRGRNDFKGLEAVLLIGEPRIPPMEVFAQAQVWHWDDELPIDFDLDESGLKQEAYPGYIAPDGKGRAYAYPGYKDSRLNRMYIYMIQAEMRQCYERIRANAPELDKATNKLQAKFVYVAAQMPCTDHVDELAHWSQWRTDHVGRTWYEAQIAAHKTVRQAEYVQALQEQNKLDWHTAHQSFLRVKAQLLKEGRIEEAGIEKTKLQSVLDWLTESSSPGRGDWSIRDLQKLLPDVGANTIQRALKIVRGGDRSSDSQCIDSITANPMIDQRNYEVVLMKKVYQLSEAKFAMYFVSPWLKEHGFTDTRDFPFSDPKAPWLTSVLDYLAIDNDKQEWLVAVQPESTSGEKPRKPDAVSYGCKKACQQIARYEASVHEEFPGEIESCPHNVSRAI
jgi:hypothetical protein